MIITRRGYIVALHLLERALRPVLAATLFVVASRIAYDQATTASLIFTVSAERAVP